MNILSKCRGAVRTYKRDGLPGVAKKLRRLLAPPHTNPRQETWQSGHAHEITFWDNYFKNKGGKYAKHYHLRLDPDYPLQPRPAALLPDRDDIHILDVGAGPLTYLGKTVPGKTIRITAVDPLADDYDRILKKYEVPVVVRTQKLPGEELTAAFAENTFDLVFARNCIDHAYDPELAVLQMLAVVKPGGYVLMEHRENEAETQHHVGLHQWNFTTNPGGDFLIRSAAKEINITQKYATRCECRCTIEDCFYIPGEPWLITRILKLPS